MIQSSLLKSGVINSSNSSKSAGTHSKKREKRHCYLILISHFLYSQLTPAASLLTELDLSLWLRCAADPILTLEDNMCVCACVTERVLYLADSPLLLTVKHCDLAGLAGRAGTCPSLAENAWFVNDLELAETCWITYTMFPWVCTHEFAHLDAHICV